jgi:uncharacterized protein (DUF1330 family)
MREINMIYVLVELRVKSFKNFEKFEKKAIAIMSRYGGDLLMAFESQRDKDSGEEIHLLSFPSNDKLNEYLNDDELHQLQELRQSAIESTIVKTSTKIKNY